jgi:hypothetical protein
MSETEDVSSDSEMSQSSAFSVLMSSSQSNQTFKRKTGRALENSIYSFLDYNCG